jgi:hypothetical protein
LLPLFEAISDGGYFWCRLTQAHAALMGNVSGVDNVNIITLLI